MCVCVCVCALIATMYMYMYSIYSDEFTLSEVRAVDLAVSHKLLTTSRNVGFEPDTFDLGRRVVCFHLLNGEKYG